MIIGKLIPAGSGFNVEKTRKAPRPRPESEETSIETIDLMSGPEGVGREREALVPAGFQSLPLDPTLALGNPSGSDDES